jgi:ketosteroid isomerase-like protein
MSVSNVFAILITLICSATIGAETAQPRTPTAEEQAVMQVTQDACAAFLRADLAAAEALLAPGFTLVNSQAVVQTREEVLGEIRKRDPVYSVFRNHSMSARVFGDAAVVQGITHVKGRSGGQPFDVEVRFTDTLIRERGQWRLVASHVTSIPPSR